MFNFFRKKKKIWYVVEDADWSIKWDGKYITENLMEQYKLDSDIRIDVNVKNSIVHGGSRTTFLPNAYKTIHQSNIKGFTWFHGTDEDVELIKSLPEAAKQCNFIHTSCEISKNDLIRWGVSEDKITVIPIGVDLNMFKPTSKEEKTTMRKKLGIPENAVVIGSFQKDGVGWEDGNEPKLIKGPDIFCDAIKLIAQKHEIFVFLTGPARGYVKKRLDEMNVPYIHEYVQDYKNLWKYYQLLDFYIVSSRAEGGPKSIMESMASGIPVISTKVGMAPEVIVDGENGFVTEINAEDISTKFDLLISNFQLQSRFAEKGLDAVKKFDWKIIAEEYYEKIYKRFL